MKCWECKAKCMITGCQSMSLVCVCRGILSLVLGSPSISQSSRNEKTPRRKCWSIEAIFQQEATKRWVFCDSETIGALQQATCTTCPPRNHLTNADATNANAKCKKRKRPCRCYKENTKIIRVKRRGASKKKHQFFWAPPAASLDFCLLWNSMAKNTKNSIRKRSIVVLVLSSLHMHGHQVPTKRFDPFLIFDVVSFGPASQSVRAANRLLPPVHMHKPLSMQSIRLWLFWFVICSDVLSLPASCLLSLLFCLQIGSPLLAIHQPNILLTYCTGKCGNIQYIHTCTGSFSTTSVNFPESPWPIPSGQDLGVTRKHRLYF